MCSQVCGLLSFHKLWQCCLSPLIGLEGRSVLGCRGKSNNNDGVKKNEKKKLKKVYVKKYTYIYTCVYTHRHTHMGLEEYNVSLILYIFLPLLVCIKWVNDKSRLISTLGMESEMYKLPGGETIILPEPFVLSSFYKFCIR